jgi:hypothetical protein
MKIGLFHVKGSPGVTTLALALAAYGRRQGAVLIEADAAGGDLALRFGLAQHPGLAEFAARARQTVDRPNVLDGLVRRVEAGKAGAVDLVPAPVEPAAVEAALAALAANPETLGVAGRDRPVLLDLGRLDGHGPGSELLEFCDARAMLVRGDVVSLGHAREAAFAADLPGRGGFVLVDTGPYRAAEAAQVLGMPCLGIVPLRRRTLRGRRATRAVRALWVGLNMQVGVQVGAQISEPATVPALVEVNGR